MDQFGDCMTPTQLALSFALVLLAATRVHAQDFHAESTLPTAAEIQKLLTASTLSAKLADGTIWRLAYKSNGYFFLNTNKGFNSKGEWKAEDGRLLIPPAPSC
jgi:hypothetical protein